MTKNNGGVWAVVVTYRPETHKLELLLDSLMHQVEGVAVVDNGSSDSFLAWLGAYQSAIPLKIFRLGDNKGIATAQNFGIEYAAQQQAAYVILFDHDSQPESDMVAKLKAVAEAKEAAGVAVAAVGPRYRDERQDNPPPFIQIHGLKVKRQPCTCGDSVVEVDYLIASGCLMPMSALAAVGNMQEEFFIDYVDIEWGLRAKNMGFQSFGACAALMSHDLGDEPFAFLGKKYPHHSALRHYYHFRNATWMYRQSWLPLHWKLADGWRLVLKYGFYTIFAKPRHQHWWMMTKGVWHGLSGRMGRLN
jgi:rhamnosyltransferase